MKIGGGMAFEPQFTMPGAFHVDGPGAGSGSGSPPRLSGVHPGLFRPPTSPSPSSSMILSRSTASVRPEATPMNAKRKRSTPKASVQESASLSDWALSSLAINSQQLPFPASQTAIDLSSRSQQRALEDDAGVGLPAMRHYMLAGKLDTPNAESIRYNTNTSNGVLDDSTYSDADYRRELGSKRHFASLTEDGSSPHLTQNPNDGTPHPQSTDGWSRMALNAVGAVVGKVWEFCKAGAFRGFYAGGGIGYDINGNPSEAPQPPLQVPTPDSRQDPHAEIYRDFDTPMESSSMMLDQDQTPISGYGHYLYGGRSTPESTPPPAAKRRQLSENHCDELRRNWVIISEPSPAERPASRSNACKLSSRKRVSSSFSQRSPASCISSPSNTPRRPSAASWEHPVSPGAPRYSSAIAASSRRRINVPVSRLSHKYAHSPSTTFSIGTNSRHKRSSSHASAAGGLSLTVREPASFAPQRSPSRSPAHRAAPPTTPNCRPRQQHSLPSTPSRIAQVIPNPFANNSTRIPSPTAPHGHRRNHSSSASQPGNPLANIPSSLAVATVASGNGGGSRRKSGAGISHDHSPRLTEEARTLASRRLQAERDVDKRMNAFNRSIQDMIRQGREALGTTVEVEFDDFVDNNGDDGAHGVGGYGSGLRSGGGASTACLVGHSTYEDDDGVGAWVDE